MAEVQQASIPSTFLMPHVANEGRSTRSTPVVFGRLRHAAFSATGATEASLAHQTERSRTLEELRQDPVYGRLWQPVPEEQPASAVEIARDQRLSILAKKYEGATLTREDEARVAILTQRLRRLAPRVTRLSWTIAEEAVAELEAVSNSIDEIGAEYGL